jgi:radical SAM protein with 4Fe4S-binding SPASM domain
MMQTPLFVAALIETTNTCNRTCWFCKFGQPRRPSVPRRMSWELIEKIVRNLKELDYRGRVSWFRINEPLADKRIYEIVAFTKQHLPDCYCTLLTNGDLLDDGVFGRLRDAGLDRLGVSVYDDATYDKIETLACRPQLATIFDRRPKQQPVFVSSRAGSIDLNVGGLPEQPARLTALREHDCLRPSTMININSDGSVVLCCHDLHDEVVMGNVTTQSLEEVWWGDKFVETREHLATVGRGGLPLCEQCDWKGTGHRREYP